jgi:hypothetical protein
MDIITAESRAHRAVEAYVRAVGNVEAVPAQERLRDLITDSIRSAVTEDREALRDRLPCGSGDPCGFEMCPHHKALIAAIMALQDGTAPKPRSLFSKPLSA